ncbi:MAG: Xyloglucanase [Calditrichaeota bacterium]|nr:Xyloglucanase [Calditrichota bacterium]
MRALSRSAPPAIAAVLLIWGIFALPRPEDRSPYRATSELLHASRMHIRGPAKQPNDWFMLQRIGPDGTLDVGGVRDASEQANRLRAQPHELDEPWTLAGPTNIGGRLTALAVHPNDPSTIYAGSAVGGVFKSIDFGATFTPVFDEDFALSAGALAIDPADPQRVWYGTGEANGSGDSYPGNGIYLTEDGGDTWEYKGLPESYHIGRIVIDPTDSERVFVAVSGRMFGMNPERGVYRTEDGGDTWEQVFFLTDSTAAVDLEINPNNPDTVFAVMWERFRTPARRICWGQTSGVWRSVNGGDTWTRLTNGLPVGDHVGRGMLAIAPTSPDRLYIAFHDDDNEFLAFYRSDDGGDSWTEYDIDGLGNQLYSSFGWYFGENIVEPGDEDVVYLGGVRVLRSMDGGVNWTTVFSDAHVDHHGFWINTNNPAMVMTGHDGGFNLSQNRGQTSQRFTYLPNTQFYAITHDATVPHRLYGGTQDNGTMRTLTGEIDDWEQIFGADGFYCLVDPRDNDVIYVCYQYGNLLRSLDGGSSFDYIHWEWNSDRTNWMTPYAFDPNNYDRLFVGTYRVWRTDNRGNDWTPISEDLTDGDDPGSLVFGTITTIDASPVSEGLIIAGTDDGNVWRTLNGGDSWTRIDDDLPDMWVSRVAFHPDSASTVFVTFSGHRIGDGTPHIFRSGDFGASWTDISGNLPEGPINDVIIDPDDPSRLYAGTDFGVFASYNYGGSWEALGTGLPTSAVFDLEFVGETRTLVAGTHGRSMYTCPLGPAGDASEHEAEVPLSPDLVVSSYPNPFNSAANVVVALPRPGELTVRVIDLLGREVATLAEGSLAAGRHRYVWDGLTASGAPAASGTYLALAESGEMRTARRIQLIR